MTKTIIKYRNIIFALSLTWTIYKLGFDKTQTSIADYYLTGSIFIITLFLLILSLYQKNKLPLMKKLLPVAALVTTFQLFGLIKLYNAPTYLAMLLPDLFSSYTGVFVLLTNFVIFTIFSSLNEHADQPV